MFPNNVGHFIIDGVANSHEWYAGKSVFVYTSSAINTIIV